MVEIQFSMILMMSLLTLALVMLMPRRVADDTIINRSRWLMAGGTALTAVQFVLQYVLRLRDMGVTQPVMVNLLFFIPISTLLSISVLNLQYLGKVKTWFWALGGITFVAVFVIITGTALIDGVPLFSDNHEMRVAEYVSAGLYSIMQLQYTYSMNRGNKRLSRALSNYFDYDSEDLLQWMKRSVYLLAFVGVGAPFFIFSTQLPLFIYALITLLAIFYLVFCFICYCVSSDSRKVLEASDNAVEVKMDEQDEEPLNMDEEHQETEEVVNRWITQGGYLRGGITMQDAVNEMNIPRYQLAAWLKTTQWELFNPWLSYLRIEEAKRLLVEHPGWNNDTIAAHCGFNSRSYFQQVFKKQTGQTPAQYLQQEKERKPIVETQAST